MEHNQNSRLALRIGALCGMLLGCLTGVQFTLAIFGLSATTVQAMGSALMLTGFVAYFLVGLVVRRVTGSVEAAASAGLLAGVAAGAMSCAAAVALDGFAPDVYAVATAQPTATASGLATVTFIGILNAAMQAALGTALALAGALVRRPQTAR